MNGEPVAIEKRKWDGSVSARWPAVLVSGPPVAWRSVALAGTRLTDVGRFADRARLMGYPAGMRRGAHEGLRDAAARLRRGEWPFDRREA